MFAKEVMQPKVISVTSDTSLEEVARLMVEHSISGIPVVDRDNHVLGVVSEMDLMQKVIQPNEPNLWKICLWGLSNNHQVENYSASVRKYMAQTAGEIMTTPCIAVDEAEDMEAVGKLMFDKKIKRVFVTKNELLTGVISRSVFTKLLLEHKHLESED